VFAQDSSHFFLENRNQDFYAVLVHPPEAHFPVGFPKHRWFFLSAVPGKKLHSQKQNQKQNH
jgi:hypothetical protein